MRLLTLPLLCLTALVHAQAPTTIVAERLMYADWPVSVRSASHDPAETAVLIVGHDGVVHWFDTATGEQRETPFMDLGENGLDIVDYGVMSEQGVNDLILDPGFDENGLFYVVYNGVRPDGTGELIDERVVCFGTNADHTEADVTVWAEVLELQQPARGHNGGQLQFGPDGYLYLSTGDGGGTGTGEPGGNSGGDDHGPIGNGQNLQTLLGKLLRIDVHGLEPYTVPSDNPFVGNPDALDEIWAYGFRNPWRWSFDRLTGDKFIADVGEVDWEEVSIERADSPGGLNFGWRIMEGPMCYDPVEDCDPNGELELPIHAYPHENGWCSVIGGYRYRGEAIPTLYGTYVHSDACGFYDVKFWALTELADGSWESAPLTIEVPGGFVPWEEVRYAFGEDNAGELYLCTRLAVYKLSYDPDDQDGTTGTVAETVRFIPNPASGEVILDAGEGVLIERLRFTDATGRVTHDVVLDNAVSPYTFYTADLAVGSYVVEVWPVGAASPIWGRLAVVAP